MVYVHSGRGARIASECFRPILAGTIDYPCARHALVNERVNVPLVMYRMPHC